MYTLPCPELLFFDALSENTFMKLGCPYLRVRCYMRLQFHNSWKQTFPKCFTWRRGYSRCILVNSTGKGTKSIFILVNFSSRHRSTWLWPVFVEGDQSCMFGSGENTHSGEFSDSVWGISFRLCIKLYKSHVHASFDDLGPYLKSPQGKFGKVIKVISSIS